MGKHENAREEVLSPGQMKELCFLAGQAVPSTFTFEQANLLLGEKKREAVRAIRVALFQALGDQNPFRFAIPLDCLEDILGWQKFYHDLFGIKTDFIFRMPKKRKGAGRLVVVFPGITAWDIWLKCQEMFPCATSRLNDNIRWSLENVKSERVAKDGGYGVWLIGNMECKKFEDFIRSFSATADVDQKHEEAVLGGITLEERLLCQLKYFKDNGRHSSKNIFPETCLGSRFFGGSTPAVGFLEGGRFLLGCTIGCGGVTGRQVIY